MVDKRVTSKLIEPRSIEKIFQIDDHIGTATSGLVADARILVERARIESQINKVTYKEPIRVEALAKRVCDFKQLYTQHAGVRPFGTALLVAGVDDTDCRLFETDPSGALIEYKGTAIGAGRSTVTDILEEKYREDMALDDAIELGLKALNEATEGKVRPEGVEIAVIDKETRKFRKLTSEEVKKHVSDVLGE